MSPRAFNAEYVPQHVMCASFPERRNKLKLGELDINKLKT